MVSKEKSWALSNLIACGIKGFCVLKLEAALLRKSGLWTRPRPGGQESQFFALFRILSITLMKQDVVNLLLWSQQCKMALSCCQLIEFKRQSCQIKARVGCSQEARITEHISLGNCPVMRYGLCIRFYIFYLHEI